MGKSQEMDQDKCVEEGLMVWVKEKPLDVIEEESLSETPARSDGSLSVLYNDHGEYFKSGMAAYQHLTSSEDPQSTLASSTLETTMLGASSRESTLPTFSRKHFSIDTSFKRLTHSHLCSCSET